MILRYRVSECEGGETCDEECHSQRQDVDEGQQAKQHCHGCGEDKRRVRRCMIEMRYQGEDSVVQITSMKASGENTQNTKRRGTHVSPMRFWIPCKLASQSTLPSLGLRGVGEGKGESSS